MRLDEVCGVSSLLLSRDLEDQPMRDELLSTVRAVMRTAISLKRGRVKGKNDNIVFSTKCPKEPRSQKEDFFSLLRSSAALVAPVMLGVACRWPDTHIKTIVASQAMDRPGKNGSAFTSFALWILVLDSSQPDLF